MPLATLLTITASAGERRRLHRRRQSEPAAARGGRRSRPAGTTTTAPGGPAGRHLQLRDDDALAAPETGLARRREAGRT